MLTAVLILTISFVVLLLLNVPIAVAIGLSTLLTTLSLGLDDSQTFYVLAQRMSNGVASFPLLAIPFFVLAGILMGRGGMARRLIAFADALAGRFTGGLAYVNVLTCMLFGAISGSAAAAISSVGGFMIPEMAAKGYRKPFAVALTTCAATTGLVIPPSNIMIVYAVVTGNVSVAATFLAGIVPGILIGLVLMAACFILGLRGGHARGSAASLGQILRTGASAALSLLLIVIVLWGILGGIFSATEASAIAVLYAFILAVVVYREVKLRDLPEILLQTGITTAVVFFLISTSVALSWVLSYERIPQHMSAALLALSDNPYVILLIINLILLFVGFFMDMTPAVLIFTPIFLPVALELGMDPVHFGIIMIANLCIGLCTPPVGTCLFVGCGVGKTTIVEVIRPMLPFLAAMVVALMLITYIPGLSLWLPNLLR